MSVTDRIERMKAFLRILIIFILAAPGRISYCQSGDPVADTTHVIRKNDRSVDESRKQKKEKKDRKDQAQDSGSNDQSTNGNTQDSKDPVKKVNSARPDMSRMRGARPPDILRPSGPLLPVGIGRPGGAFRPGGH